MILLLALLLSQPWEPPRIEAALYVAAKAWGHDPAMFRGLAEVESGLEANPRRTKRIDPLMRRWGPKKTRTTYPWRLCSLLQLRGGLSASDGGTIPPCEALVLFPSLASWWGARHLAGYREQCGDERQYAGYHTGSCGKPGSFTAKVRRLARRGK